MVTPSLEAPFPSLQLGNGHVNASYSSGENPAMRKRQIPLKSKGGSPSLSISEPISPLFSVPTQPNPKPACYFHQSDAQFYLSLFTPSLKFVSSSSFSFPSLPFLPTFFELLLTSL